MIVLLHILHSLTNIVHVCSNDSQNFCLVILVPYYVDVVRHCHCHVILVPYYVDVVRHCHCHVAFVVQ